MNEGNKIHFSENFSEALKQFKPKHLSNTGFVSRHSLEQGLWNKWERKTETEKEWVNERDQPSPTFHASQRLSPWFIIILIINKNTVTGWKQCTDFQSTTADIKQVHQSDETDHYHNQPQLMPQRNKMTTQITTSELLWSLKLVEISLTLNPRQDHMTWKEGVGTWIKQTPSTIAPPLFFLSIKKDKNSIRWYFIDPCRGCDLSRLAVYQTHSVHKDNIRSRKESLC